ncbi:MAG TPA: hypothetical protein VEX39_14500 [Thermoleophilaceae bacterium]|nr:hypothetical protein [Thermoleophilaceae bacterium]
MISGFFVNTEDGRVATQGQLAEAGLIDDMDKAVAPWHPIKGDRDASTLWFAVLVKQMRGVFIGMLCIRHSDRQASMEADGWVEVPVASIGV